jgi:hypothetical protein
MKPLLTSYVRLAEIVVVLILLGFALLTYRELTDLRKVPVSLPNYEFDISSPPDSGPVVVTRGTWISASGIPEKLQTTTIECRKGTMRCMQSAAVIVFIEGRGLMESTQTEFEVERWNDKEIVTKATGDSCSARTLMLDLVEKRARSRVTMKRELSRCPEGNDRTLDLVAGYKARAETPSK